MAKVILETANEVITENDKSVGIAIMGSGPISLRSKMLAKKFRDMQKEELELIFGNTDSTNRLSEKDEDVETLANGTISNFHLSAV